MILTTLVNLFETQRSSIVGYSFLGTSSIVLFGLLVNRFYTALDAITDVQDTQKVATVKINIP